MSLLVVPEGIQAGPPDRFSGQVWMERLDRSAQEAQIHRVTFSPGAQTHWHQHTHAQLLIVTAGTGWVQVQGEAAVKIRSGDVFEVPAQTLHWHGADVGSVMQHLALQSGDTFWSHPVQPDLFQETIHAADAL